MTSTRTPQPAGPPGDKSSRRDLQITPPLRFVLSILAMTLFLPLLVVGLFTWAPLADPQPGGEELSTLVLDRNGEILRVYPGSRGEWYFPRVPAGSSGSVQIGLPAQPIQEDLSEHQYLPPDSRLVTALITAEDQGFFGHGGLDPIAILRAIRLNLRAGEIVSGGSTITMQLARLMAERPRTLASKIVEAVQALMMERRYTKQQILEFYLARAPYGGNIRGISAASRLYFGRGVSELTWSEAALLAVLPNAPGLIHPSADSQTLLRRRNQLLQTLATQEVISELDLQASLAEPIPTGRYPLPFLAPHAADLVRVLAARTQQSGAGSTAKNPTASPEPPTKQPNSAGPVPAASPDNPRILHTTLDSHIQKEVEFQAWLAAQTLKNQGIQNLSVLVVHNPSGEIRALVGNPDYFDVANNGFVNGTIRRRSTGSILKPLLYGMGFDQGLILPNSLVADIPLQFGSFTPQNADKRFRGLVPVSRALAESLNLPAVSLLEQIGVPIFYQGLVRLGFEGLFRESGEYGLSLILGGAEASPWEVAQMYRAIALGGSSVRIHLTPALDTAPGAAVLSPGAASLLVDILQLPSRPDSQAGWQELQTRRPVAWKTGTSYGQRDAWAAGFTPLWTVVVWAGNFSGQGNTNLSSTESAGSLLFAIHRILAEDTSSVGWFRPQAEWFRSVEVCTDTGYRASPSCPQTTPSKMPVQAQPLKLCPYHQGGGDPRVLSFYRGQSIGDPPPWLGQVLDSHQEFRITYPEPGIHIITSPQGRIRLRAAYPKSNGHLYWYLNGRYLGRTEEDSGHWWDVDFFGDDFNGDVIHKLTLVNDQGLRLTSRFTVQLPNQPRD